MLRAKGLDDDKALGKRPTFAVAGRLADKGPVQELLQPAQLRRAHGHQLVSHAAFARGRVPVVWRLQRRPAQGWPTSGWLRSHEDIPACTPVPEDQLLLTAHDRDRTVAVYLPGSLQCIAVADNQVPLTKVVDQKIAEPHGVDADVVLAEVIAVDLGTRGREGDTLHSEDVAAEERVAVLPRTVGVHAAAAHLRPDKPLKVLVNVPRAWPIDFNDTFEDAAGAPHGSCPRSPLWLLVPWIRRIGRVHLTLVLVLLGDPVISP
mmetsp:Transcript_21270/g.60188  ORF Transcript_21270/g.60188 Transcript_21270/m.60188 type:complete len:262 (-) Transcript_21270:1306-2091(-)